jgi:cytochrome P450
VTRQTSARPPGPGGRGLPLLWRALTGNRFAALQDLTTRYGDVVFFSIAGAPYAVLNHPDYVRDVLVTQHRAFHKGVGLERARALLGNGLLTSEDGHHQRQRRLIQPAFHRERLAGYAATMAAFTERYIAGWQPGETRDMAREMPALTLAIAGKTLFAAEVEDRAGEIGRAVTQALAAFNIALMPYGEHLVNWPIPPARRFRRAKASLDAIVYRMIAERRASGASGSDVLSTLVAARDEDDGGAMTDEQVRDEVMTLLLAGHETTANALTWTWYLLSQHPRVRETLEIEVCRVGGDRPLSFLDLPSLPYTRAVLAESMRLFPPAYLVGRRALDEYRIPNTGFAVPARTVIFLSQYLLHRDPRFWDEPGMFRPDRWLAGEPAKDRFAYFPFGAGPRICIGEQFAWMEGVIVLATIARRWRFELDPRQRIALDPTITLRAKHGMRMTLAAT